VSSVQDMRSAMNWLLVGYDAAVRFEA